MPDGRTNARGHRPRVARGAIAAFLLAIGSVATASGTPGALDTAFAVSGVASIPVDADGWQFIVTCVTVQADGRTVAAGRETKSGAFNRWGVRRFLVDGSPDPSFGTGGRVVVPFGGVDQESAWALTTQPDGRIVVGGVTCVNVGTVKKPKKEWRLASVRLGADGALDPSWGSGGKAVTSLVTGVLDEVRIAQQPDGKIVLAGRSGNSLRLVRWTTTGSLDPAYGTGGTALHAMPATFMYLRGAALDGFDRLYVAMDMQGSSPASYVARITSSGALDADFPIRNLTTDTQGIVTYLNVKDVVVQGDGKPLVLVRGRFGAEYDCIVLRYDHNGALDGTFGSGGIARSLWAGEDNARYMALQPDGRILVGAELMPVAGVLPARLTAFRFLPDGSLDAGFGSGGAAEPVVLSGVKGITWDPNGRIVLGQTRGLVRWTAGD